jgi:beta-xylosidase
MRPQDYWHGDFVRGKYILGTLLAVMLVAALFYFYGGSQAPAGQPPLENITAQNVADVRSQFNSAKNAVRVLLLLSPT